METTANVKERRQQKREAEARQNGNFNIHFLFIQFMNAHFKNNFFDKELHVNQVDNKGLFSKIDK